MERRLWLSILGFVLIGVTTACNERSAPVARVSGVLKDARVAGQSDLVATPAGWYHRDCVQEVPNGAVVGVQGKVTLSDGSTYQLPRCSHPGRVVTAERSNPASAAIPGPSYNNWIEYAEYNPSPGTPWGELDASWHVPHKPSVDYTGKVYYTFPGLQDAAPTAILQPVLGYDHTDAWYTEPTRCDSTCNPGPTGSASVGDSIVGSVRDSSCSNTTCTWVISIADESGTTTYSSISIQDTLHYTDAFAGAVEVYGLTNCDQFPDTAVYYTGLALYDTTGQQVTPEWQGHVAQTGCDFRPITSLTDPTRVSLLYHNNANPVVTVTGPGQDSAYSYVTMDASVSVGPSPYSYSWAINGVAACSDQSSCTGQLGAQGTWTVFSVTVTDGDEEQGVGADSVYAQWPQCQTCNGPTKRGG